MAKPILMPQLGMIMTEGTVAKWHKAAGDTVEKGEPLFEVTTDKIAQEVEATETGLLHIVAETDAVVDVGSVIGYLLEAGEAPPTAPVAAVSAPRPLSRRRGQARWQARWHRLPRRLRGRHRRPRRAGWPESRAWISRRCRAADRGAGWWRQTCCASPRRNPPPRRRCCRRGK